MGGIVCYVVEDLLGFDINWCEPPPPLPPVKYIDLGEHGIVEDPYYRLPRSVSNDAPIPENFSYTPVANIDDGVTGEEFELLMESAEDGLNKYKETGNYHWAHAPMDVLITAASRMKADKIHGWQKYWDDYADLLTEYKMYRVSQQ